MRSIMPVITMLNVIAVGKAISPTGTQLIHVDNRYGEKTLFRRDPLDPVVSPDRFVQHVRGESMRLVGLKRKDKKVARGRKRRTHTGSAIVDCIAEEAAVDAIFAEVLVEPNVVLFGVIVTG